MALRALAKACGSNKLPGAKLEAYFTYISELASWPATEAEDAGTAQGDTVLLSEAFDFTGAATGTGMWRKVNAILVDTPDVTNSLAGEMGGHRIQQRYNFFLPKNDAAALEWLNDLVAAEGCTVWLIPTKDGNYHVMGDLENGVFVEALEGGTGPDRSGYQITLYANTGLTTLLYPADTLGIDITPNA